VQEVQKRARAHISFFTLETLYNYMHHIKSQKNDQARKPHENCSSLIVKPVSITFMNNKEVSTTAESEESVNGKKK